MENQEKDKIEAIQSLPDKFTKTEYSTAPGVYEKHKESDKAFIYKRTDEGVYWEVFQKRVSDQYGKRYIQYPSDKSFGRWAWCYNNYDKAMRHFNHLTERKKTDPIKP